MKKIEIENYSYMDQLILYILVISLEHVPEPVLRDARSTLCALIFSLPSLTRITLQNSFKFCIFFNTLLQLLFNKNPSSVILHIFFSLI